MRAKSWLPVRRRLGLRDEPGDSRGGAQASSREQPGAETLLHGAELEASPLFRVVFVCTGNRARSPLAEALFGRRIGTLPVHVSSCGTLDLAGKPPLAEAVAVAAALGIDLRTHRAQPLRLGALAGADLVVGFEPSHVEGAVDVGLAERGHAFLLLELPTLLAGVPTPVALSAVERARQVVADMDTRRGRDRSADDRLILRDPFGESRQRFAEMARVVDAMTGLLATRLFPDTDSI